MRRTPSSRRADRTYYVAYFVAPASGVSPHKATNMSLYGRSRLHSSLRAENGPQLGGVLSSASDDEVGGIISAIRARDVRAADLQEKPTKTVEIELLRQRCFRRMRRRRRLPSEDRSERSEQSDRASEASGAIKPDRAPLC